MKSFLFVLLVGYAVRCDDMNYYVIEVPENTVRSKPFKVYWNVPTKQCKSKYIPFEDLYEKFGIIQNSEDKFIGEKIAILYDPGIFPALFKDDSKGQFRFRNGGVPQQGDLEIHLKQFLDDLNTNIDEQFDGIGIIDFESWRPIYRQNFGELRPYKDVSYEIEKNNHWWWNKAKIEAEAKRRFEESGQLFMAQTIALARRKRPKARWGFYGFPYCFNMATNNMREQCAARVNQENDRLKWLWQGSTALYPSLYSSSSLSTSQLRSMIRGRVKEAARCAKGLPVLPYFWYKYREGGFFQYADLEAALETVYNSSASGIIIWGSSNDVNTVDKCHHLYNYVNKVMGPAIAKYTKTVVKEEQIVLSDKELDSDKESIEIDDFRKDIDKDNIETDFRKNIDKEKIETQDIIKDIDKETIEKEYSRKNIDKEKLATEDNKKNSENSKEKLVNFEDLYPQQDKAYFEPNENVTHDKSSKVEYDKAYSDKLTALISDNEEEIKKVNNLIYIDLILKALSQKYPELIESVADVQESIENLNSEQNYDFDYDMPVTTEYVGHSKKHIVNSHTFESDKTKHRHTALTPNVTKNLSTTTTRPKSTTEHMTTKIVPHMTLKRTTTDIPITTSPKTTTTQLIEKAELPTTVKSIENSNLFIPAFEFFKKVFPQPDHNYTTEPSEEMFTLSDSFKPSAEINPELANNTKNNSSLNKIETTTKTHTNAVDNVQTLSKELLNKYFFKLFPNVTDFTKNTKYDSLHKQYKAIAETEKEINNTVKAVEKVIDEHLKSAENVVKITTTETPKLGTIRSNRFNHMSHFGHVLTNDQTTVEEEFTTKVYDDSDINVNYFDNGEYSTNIPVINERKHFISNDEVKEEIRFMKPEENNNYSFNRYMKYATNAPDNSNEESINLKIMNELKAIKKLEQNDKKTIDFEERNKFNHTNNNQNVTYDVKTVRVDIADVNFTKYDDDIFDIDINNKEKKQNPYKNDYETTGSSYYEPIADGSNLQSYSENTEMPIVDVSTHKVHSYALKENTDLDGYNIKSYIIPNEDSSNKDIFDKDTEKLNSEMSNIKNIDRKADNIDFKTNPTQYYEELRLDYETTTESILDKEDILISHDRLNKNVDDYSKIDVYTPEIHLEDQNYTENSTLIEDDYTTQTDSTINKDNTKDNIFIDNLDYTTKTDTTTNVDIKDNIATESPKIYDNYKATIEPTTNKVDRNHNHVETYTWKYVDNTDDRLYNNETDIHVDIDSNYTETTTEENNTNTHNTDHTDLAVTTENVESNSDQYVVDVLKEDTKNISRSKLEANESFIEDSTASSQIADKMSGLASSSEPITYLVLTTVNIIFICNEFL